MDVVEFNILVHMNELSTNFKSALFGSNHGKNYKRNRCLPHFSYKPTSTL